VTPEQRQHALIFNAITQGLIEVGPFVPLSVREHVARLVGQALRDDAADLAGPDAVQARMDDRAHDRTDDFMGALDGG
jgi:hypothetical protein